MALSEQEKIRRNSLSELKKLGVDPYPAAEYPVNVTASEIKENFEEGKEIYQEISFAGRIMGRRIMGAASFVELKDSTGRIQAYIKRDAICPNEDKSLYNVVFKRLLDIGDIIGVKGYVFITKMGEISIHVQELTVLSKALRPLPVIKEKDGKTYDAFTDPELRYRQRYVDLIVNDHVSDVFVKRSKIIQSMRNFITARGYLEVETPILQAIPGGASAKPFITHHNSLDIPMYLRIANELYLKRLIVGGFEGVFEFAKDFRNEGMDRTHNPEFTQMEIYVSYKDYKWMMNFTEEMLETISTEVHGTTELTFGENQISFKAPYARVPILEAIKVHTGHDLNGKSEDEIRAIARELGIQADDFMGKGKLIDEIHTPDSSRYFYKEGYEERFAKGENQKQLSKEFVREWLMENGFQGQEGQEVPEMTDDYVQLVSDRYIELYERIIGEKFVKGDVSQLLDRVEKNVLEFLK